MKFKSLMLGLVQLCLASILLCETPVYATPPVETFVSGYSDAPLAVGTRYLILAEDKLEPDRFEFKEFSAYVERALSTKGLVRVESASDADIIVFLGYGIGPPKTEVASYSMPIFGQTGVSSSYTSGTISKGGTVSATTTNVPTYGVTGSTSSAESYKTYDRWLRVAAVSAAEFRKSGRTEQVWRTEVKSTGTIGDLRFIMPRMAFSLSQYVGTDTGKAIKVKVKDKSKELSAFMALPVSGVGLGK